MSVSVHHMNTKKVINDAEAIFFDLRIHQESCLCTLDYRNYVIPSLYQPESLAPTLMTWRETLGIHVIATSK